MKKGLYLFRNLLVLASMICVGCESNAPESDVTINKNVLTGKVQKGPFVEGTDVIIFSLDNLFSQTGVVFKTSIVDKHGAFEKRDMNFSSQFVELVATGYYYNEVKGELSSAPLSLSAIADISSSDNVNVNILTTLERERILYLIANGSNFQDAKKQAHREVLAVFGMSPSQVGDAVGLDLERDARLLVISAIVQGLRPTAEVTQLLANIASDIREDGSLDNMKTASVLKNNSMGLDAETLVQNMESYDLDYTYSQNDVESLLQEFISNTPYTQTEFVTYPTEAEYGQNVLAGGTFHVGQQYSFAAETPVWCPLKVEVQGIGEWYIEILPDAPENWIFDSFKDMGGYHSQLFTVKKPGEPSLLKFQIGEQRQWDETPLPEGAPEPNTLRILLYENSDVPTREMIIQTE